MTKGPRGERRLADAVGCAVTVAKIATGEIDDTQQTPPAKRESGLVGARARSAALTPQKRSEIASVAAAATWEDRQ